MMLPAVLTANLLEDPSDFMLFLGRFHPLVVHLPIGFLLLAALAQWAAGRPKFHPIQPFLTYLWGLGALSAALAVVFGYLLSLSGDYDTETLFWHQWSGVAVFIFSLFCYFVSIKQPKNTGPIRWTLIALTTGTMLYAGHLGGNLTHGSTYLWEYAPNAVRRMAGLPPKKQARPKVMVLDSADVYLDIVEPMLERKCVSCHNPGKKKGGLTMTTHTQLMKGGDSGKVVLPGDVQGSELYRRITLPDGHDEFMPSEGKLPLTEQEVTIIEWWIASGAPPKGSVTSFEIGPGTRSTLRNHLGLDKNAVLARTVAPANQAVVDSLLTYGFIVNRLMKDNHLLEANFGLSEKPIEASALEVLTGIKEQLIWLDLGHAELSDAAMEKIGQLENLLKLDLSGNPITDEGIGHLTQLDHLETLNLYQTQVSEGILELLPKLTRLRSLYVWQTQINDSLMSRIRAENPKIQIIGHRAGEHQEL